MSEEYTFDCCFYLPLWLPEKGRWVPGVKPRAARLNWPKLSEGLTRFREAPEKAKAPGWQPVRLTAPYRSAANVEHVSCLVLDCDDGTDPETASKAWSDWPHIWHTTWSSTPEAPKVRIVVPLEVPCPVKWFPRLWRWAQERIGGVADEQAKDASRYYFLPTRGPAGDCRSGVHDPGGYCLDPRPWETLPETPGERAAREAKTRASNRPPPAPTTGDFSRARSRLLNEDAETRRALGVTLGGRAHDDRVNGVPCPSCGRRSVWWPLAPVGTPKAMCGHRNSCGWTGWLDTLGDR